MCKATLISASGANRKFRRGFTALWIGIGMVVILGLCSLAVDYGRIQAAKTELRTATDAASRAAVAGIATSVTQAQNNAINIAANMTCDGTAVTLATNDIDFGTWDPNAKTFTVLSGAARSNANAIRIKAKRTSANGNPINLYFAPAIGKSTCNVTASSIALVSAKTPAMATFGTLSCTNQPFIASYDSSVTTAPTRLDPSTWSANAVLGSNGVVGQGEASAGTLNGDLYLGPSGSINGLLTVTGTVTNLTSALTVPATVTMQHVTNPSGVSASQNLAKNAVVSWPGGTYYFSSFTCSEAPQITFTGPAVVYMDGDFTADKNTVITPYQAKPSNLIWYQAAGKTFSVQQNCTITMEFISPGANFSATDALAFMGRILCNNLTVGKNLELYYDKQLGVGSGVTVVSTVQ